MKRDETAVLAERRSISPDAFLLTFETSTLASNFVPGQFTMLQVPALGGLLRRPYSFCASEPDRGRFTLLVKVVGVGSRALAELGLGQTVACLGPLGTSFRLPPAETHPVIVAGGVGIAPFIGFCQELSRRGRRASVLLGGRQAHDLYLKDDFEALGMDVRCTTEDGSSGKKGLVTDRISELVDLQGRCSFFSCGPTGMLKKVAAMAGELGFPCQVSIERRMGCGVGCCLGCVVFTRQPDEAAGEYRRTCTEGPVFDAETICWDKDPFPL